MVDHAHFDVKFWLQANSPADCERANLSQPVRLGNGFTKNGQAILHNDWSGLSALRLPPTPVNLNVGLDSFRPKSGEHAGIERLILAAKAGEISLSNCDILTFRNNLNKILGTVFDPRKAWAVDACALNGILYLDIVNESTETYDNIETFTAWGYQFEAKCTGKESADANCEYNMLVSVRLGAGRADDSGALRLFIGAEIDAFDPQGTRLGTSEAPGLETLRELKTYRAPQHAGQRRSLHNYKAPRWWLQSYLVGVPALVLGSRDDHGIVHSIDVVRISELPRISWTNRAAWSPQQALCFGADVLTWMRQVTGEVAGKHVRVRYDPALGKLLAQEVEGGDLSARIHQLL